MDERLHAVPADTTSDAARVQLAALRRLSPDRRLEMALELSDSLRSVTAAGVRSRHPEFTEEQVHFAVLRLTLGNELFAKVYPGARTDV